jgi:hypothetical protein
VFTTPLLETPVAQTATTATTQNLEGHARLQSQRTQTTTARWSTVHALGQTHSTTITHNASALLLHSLTAPSRAMLETPTHEETVSTMRKRLSRWASPRTANMLALLGQTWLATFTTLGDFWLAFQVAPQFRATWTLR